MATKREKISQMSSEVVDSNPYRYVKHIGDTKHLGVEVRIKKKTSFDRILSVDFNFISRNTIYTTCKFKY